MGVGSEEASEVVSTQSSLPAHRAGTVDPSVQKVLRAQILEIGFGGRTEQTDILVV